MPARLTDYPVAHAGIRPVLHPELGVEINGQTAVRYLRFLRPVHVDRLELSPLVYGRWIPAVPTHPAHLIVSVLDRDTCRWRTVKEVDLPPDERIAGRGLRPSTPVATMDAHFKPVLDAPPRRLPLGGIETDLLRVECDREHPVWPNHGECNGGPFNVPFGILDRLVAFGRAPAEPISEPDWPPPLERRAIRPAAPAGMTVTARPHEVRFEGERLSVGFSLVRPMLTSFGWDAAGAGRAGRNRLQAARDGRSRAMSRLIGGLSGPWYRLLDHDLTAHLFTGHVQVDGHRVSYHNLTAGPGLQVDAVFTVDADMFTLEIFQTADAPIPALEAEPWRLLWNLTAGMTSTASPPVTVPGRNGRIDFPAMVVGDDSGGLLCERTDTGPGPAWMQTDSARPSHVRVNGFVLSPPAGNDAPLIIPAGTRTATFALRPVELLPAGVDDPARLSPGLRRAWCCVYTSFRPELGGFSNNAASVNCHVNQWVTADQTVFSRPSPGFDPMALARYTIGRALLDGGGYGYCRQLYLDSDPILMSAAGRLHQLAPDLGWLRRMGPGIVAIARRMLATFGRDGLAVCRTLTGNSGSYRWSCNAMDVVGFGHLDAYVNAWTYRGLRNAAALLPHLGENALARRCRDRADRQREPFARLLINPDTGWAAGWRSRDGQLHDYAFIWVNGPVCAFGILPPELSRRALEALERLRAERGPAGADCGLPSNLLPIHRPDHMLGRWFQPWEPTYENYTDGSLMACSTGYYLRALAIHGFSAAASSIAADLDRGYADGRFAGGSLEGVEFHSWDGLNSGYEGTFGPSAGPLYAIAIQQGLIAAPDPEWWPAEGI